MSSKADDKKVNPWKIVLIGGPVLLVVVIAAFYSLFAFAFPQGKAQYAARYQATLKKLDGASLAPDRMALLQEIGVLAGRRDASLPAVVMLVGVASDALRDRQLSDDECDNLVLVRDFVTAKEGSVGFEAMGAFLADHPGIKVVLENGGIPSNAPADSSSSKTSTHAQTQGAGSGKS